MLLRVLAMEGAAGSDMKGESSAMRSAAAVCYIRNSQSTVRYHIRVKTYWGLFVQDLHDREGG